MALRAESMPALSRVVADLRRWSALIYRVPQLIAGVAAGLVFHAFNLADK